MLFRSVYRTVRWIIAPRNRTASVRRPGPLHPGALSAALPAFDRLPFRIAARMLIADRAPDVLLFPANRLID